MKNEPSVEQFAAAGEAAGTAYAAFRQGFITAVAAHHPTCPPKEQTTAAAKAFEIYYQSVIDGLTVDQYGIPHGDDDVGNGHCAQCWCNTCDLLEVCACYSGSDGITPAPCAACGDNAPLKPRSLPRCSEHQTTPEECKACWCKECGNFEECVVEKDGYDPSSKPCPCDGCNAGQRFMPKENPPCNNYIGGQ